MTTTREYPLAALCFAASASPTITAAPAPAAGETRKNATIAGIANSGADMPGFFGRVVVDLSTAQIARRAQVPILLDHETPVGFATGLRITERGLEYQGEIIDQPSNAEGRRIVEFAQGGLQWQMSMQAIPTFVEVVPPGVKVNVNGREFVGPIDVFRNSEIRELTITATGRDDQTQMTMFAAAEKVAVPLRSTQMAEQPKGDASGPATVEELTKLYPALVELIKQQAKAEGIEEERKRSEGAMDQAEQAAKPEQGKQPAPAAMAASLKRARFHITKGTPLADIQADFASLKEIGAFSAPAPTETADRGSRFKSDPIDESVERRPAPSGSGDDQFEAAQARFNADPNLRREFGTAEAYFGFCILQQRRKARSAV